PPCFPNPRRVRNSPQARKTRNEVTNDAEGRGAPDRFCTRPLRPGGKLGRKLGRPTERWQRGLEALSAQGQPGQGPEEAPAQRQRQEGRLRQVAGRPSPSKKTGR